MLICEPCGNPVAQIYLTGYPDYIIDAFCNGICGSTRIEPRPKTWNTHTVLAIWDEETQDI